MTGNFESYEIRNFTSSFGTKYSVVGVGVETALEFFFIKI